MNRSSLTEDTPATPGWVDARISAIFQPFGPEVRSARDRYADCLASVNGALDVDQGHDQCRIALLQAVRDLVADTTGLDRELQALEAELSNAT